MKWVIVIFTAGLFLTGCKSTKDGGDAGLGGDGSTDITPVFVFSGKVALVKNNLKYVVIQGGIGEVPPAGSKLNVYRGENKVGELQVSTQSQASNYAADILSGSIEVGDTVRSR